jgi:hypothetical protein
MPIRRLLIPLIGLALLAGLSGCATLAALPAAAVYAGVDLSGYCYRRLGRVTCYSTPDPTASDEIRVH